MITKIVFSSSLLITLVACDGGNLLSEKIQRDIAAKEKETNENTNSGNNTGGTTTGDSNTGGNTTGGSTTGGNSTGGTTSGGTTTGGSTSGNTSGGTTTGGSTTGGSNTPTPTAAPPTPSPTPSPTPPGGGVPQDPPPTAPTPAPIGAGQSCLVKHPDMLTKFGFSDPFIDCQWHLMNRVQDIVKTLPNGQTVYSIKGKSGADVNAHDAYAQDYSGNGVNILIADDSFAKDHPDMQANYNQTLSVGCNNAVGSHPHPGMGYNHGVEVSGLAGAVGKNGIGVAGVAHKAKVSGHNVFECDSFDNSYNAPTGVHVWNASWGKDANYKIETSQSLLLATESGINRGITYFKSAGNSRNSLGRNSAGYPIPGYSDHNFDEDNTPNIAHVAALGVNGNFTNYSSPGAGLFISSYGAYQSGNEPGTTTISRTETGSYTYTTTMNGTSAASPISAGVAAVIKSAKAAISPIDLMYIIAKTATPISNPRTSTSYMGNPIGISGKEYINWTKNAKGYWHSFDTGFGSINTAAGVEMAKTYTPKLSLPQKYSVTQNGNQIPKSDSTSQSIGPGQCATKSINISNDFQVFANLFSFNVSSSNSAHLGKLIMYFRMPSGVLAQLKRLNDNPSSSNRLTGSAFAHSQKWKAMAAFGENAKGTWHVEICYAGSIGSFNFQEAQMEIYGFTDMNSIGAR